LLHLIYGEANTAVGYQAGAHLYEASENTIFGRLALRDGVFVDGDVAVGYNAGIHHQEGLRCIFLGRESGENFVKGNRNMFLGGSAGQDHTLDSGHEFSNKFICEFANNGRYLQGDHDIGSLALGLDTADLGEIEDLGPGFYCVPTVALLPSTDGRINASASSTIPALSTRSDSTSARTILLIENPNGSVGTIVASGSGTAFNTSSDARDKIALGIPDSLAKINALQVHLARFKSDEEGSERAMLFAQEAEQVTPYAVTVPSDLNDRYQMDYSKLVPDLIAAVQEQQKQIEALRSEIADLRQ
jgi:hypothetical protein